MDSSIIAANGGLWLDQIAEEIGAVPLEASPHPLPLARTQRPRQSSVRHPAFRSRSAFVPVVAGAPPVVPTWAAALTKPSRVPRAPSVVHRLARIARPPVQPIVPPLAAWAPIRTGHHPPRALPPRGRVVRPPAVIANGLVAPIGPGGTVLAIAAEAGSRVTMSWVTDVMKSWSGMEQRVSLNRWPRLRFDFAAKLTDAENRRLLSELAGSAASAPVFLLGMAHEDMSIVSSAGTAITVPSLALCDWAQPGRRVVVVSPSGSTVDGVIQSASGVTITTTTDLSATATPGSGIMPACPVYLDGDQAFGRYRTKMGTWSLVARAERPFAVPTMGVGATVTTYDGLPVWDLGNATNFAAQPLRSGVDLVDMGGRIGALGNFTEVNWGRALVVAGRGRADWQWLKAFLDAVRGQQMPFLLPTGRPDLVVASGDASGGTVIVQGPPTTDAPDYVNDWFPSLAHRRLRLLKADGTAAYRTITGAIDNGNGTQTLTLDSALAGALSRLEFLETVRLDSDDVAVSFGSPGFSASLSALVVQR